MIQARIDNSCRNSWVCSQRHSLVSNFVSNATLLWRCGPFRDGGLERGNEVLWFRFDERWTSSHHFRSNYSRPRNRLNRFAGVHEDGTGRDGMWNHLVPRSFTAWGSRARTNSWYARVVSISGLCGCKIRSSYLIYLDWFLSQARFLRLFSQISEKQSRQDFIGDELAN